MSIASLRKILRSARKGLCSTCSKTEYPQLEAAGAGHVGCLMYTVETQGLTVKDANNVSAVHVAARKGQLEVLIFLVENGLVNDTFRAKNGATPGHDAAGTGNIECMRYLLVHTGCSAHDKDYSGQTLLHWAAMFGQLRAVIWLVKESNATINAENTQGLTAVHLAAQKNRVDVVHWLVKYTYKTHPNPRDVVNQRSKQGATPLFLAATEGNIQVIRWLAEKAGGDPTIFSFTGVAPLHAAVAMGHQEAVQYLFQFGVGTAPGGLRTRDGSTTLHMAARCGHTEIVKWLLSQKQVSGNEKDHTQYTAAHEAAEHGHVKILKFLFDHGVNVDAPDINGNTPLDIAMRMRRRACENFLKAAVAARPNGVRRPVVRKESTNNSHLDDYGTDSIDGVAAQLSVDMEEVIVQEATEAGMFPTLRDMMGQEEMQKLSSSKSNQEGSMQEMRKLKEEERKRKALTAKIEEEQRRRQQIMAKKKEKEREEEATIRARLLSESSIETPELEEVEKYITRSAAQVTEGQRRVSLVEERKNTFELSNGAAEEKTPAKKTRGFLQRLRKSVSAPGSLRKLAPKEPPPERHVLKADTFNATPSTKPSFLNVPTHLPMADKTSVTEHSLQTSPGDRKDDEGSVTSLISSQSGDSSAKVSAKKLRRRQQLENKTPWVETGEALRAGMNWTYSELHQSGSSPIPARRRRPRVRRLTPAPQPIKARLAQKGHVPKLNLDETPHSKSAKSHSAEQLSNAVKDSLSKGSSQPRFMRQHGQRDEVNTPSPPPSPTLAGIEDELSKMQDTALALQNPSQAPTVLLKRLEQPNASPEELTDSEEDYSDSEEEEESSSGDSDSTASSGSSDRKHLRHPTQPNVASLRAGLARGGLLGPRAISGRSGSPRKALAGQFSRLRRRIMRLPAIPEEREKEAKALEEENMGPEERATAVYRLRLQWKIFKSWQSYYVFMAFGREKAEAMMEQRNEDLMRKVFDAWLNLTQQALVDSISQVAEQTAIKASLPPQSAVPPRQPTGVPEFMRQWPARMIAPTPPKDTPDTRTSRKEEYESFTTSLPTPKVQQAPAHPPPPAASPPVKEAAATSVDPKKEMPSPLGGEIKRYQRRSSLVKMSNADKSLVYLEWLNDQLEALDLPKVDDISDSIANGVAVLKVLVNLSGRKMPHIHPNPKFFPQFMNNWKLVRDEMQALGMKTMGIEPEDLSKKDEAVIHLMFNIILKWWNAQYPV